ncbi:hypothetical protein LINPERPRIM_LOCUS2129 [Linum perenne]
MGRCFGHRVRRRHVVFCEMSRVGFLMFLLQTWALALSREPS